MTEVGKEFSPKPRQDLTIETIDENLVVLDKMHGRIHQLNGTASRIWVGIADGRSLRTIAGDLAEEFDVTVDAVTSDIESVLGQFEALSLLESR